MELFLLLSMGLALVAFISIALNQPPPNSTSDTDLPISLEYALLHPDKMAVLKIEDHKIGYNFEPADLEEELKNLSESVPNIGDRLLVAEAAR